MNIKQMNQRFNSRIKDSEFNEWDEEYDKDELISYVKDMFEQCDINEGVISHALSIMNRNRCPLSYANDEIYDAIQSAISDFALDNGLSEDWQDDIDIEELFWEVID